MPDVTIEIGGREFSVACQAGEEPFLHSAARMLDAEAQGALIRQFVQRVQALEGTDAA